MAENQSTPIPDNWMRTFIPIWAAQALSLLGSGLVQFALVWWLTQKTGSATVLATATAVALLPELILGPFAGAVVDRWNRRIVMMVADGSIALLTTGLGLLYWSGHIQVWHIYVAMFLRAVGGIFHFPAMQASTSLMVPEKHLARVAGLNQSLRGAISIAAPPLAALLLNLLPFYGILSIDVSTAALAVGILFFISIPQPVRAAPVAGKTSPTILHDVAAAFKYIASWPGMLLLLVLASLLNFVYYPTSTLMPLLVTRHFGGGAWHLSALESLYGFGVVAGGLILGAWGGFRRKIYTSLAGLLAMGASFFLVAAAPKEFFTLALIGMCLSGVMNVMTNAPLFALLQSKVAPEMQGRVFMLVGSIAGMMGPLSMVFAGPAADQFGIRSWYWVAAVVTMMMGLVAFAIPAITRLDTSEGKAAAPVLAVPIPSEPGD